MSKLDDVISDVGYILEVLMAYRNIVQSGCCNDCEYSRECDYKPKLGQLVRYNCLLYDRRENHDGAV